MAKYKVEVDGRAEAAQEAAAPEPIESVAKETIPQGGDAVAVAATVGVVVVGAALLEAALVPAILIGAAAALAPKYFQRFGERIEPVLHSSVRGAIKLGRKAQSVMGEAQEKIHDITAEVHAEEIAAATTPAVHEAA